MLLPAIQRLEDADLALATGPGALPEGESILLLSGGRQAYPRMLRAIAGARASVHLEVYAFAVEGVGRRFIAALAQAVRRGVSVQVLIDGWGSVGDGRAVAQALSAAGVGVRVYNPLTGLLVGRFGRNHRKIMLVDDEIAFLGGINIGEENLSDGTDPGWADLALEVRGPQSAQLRRMIERRPLRPLPSSLGISLCGLGGGWRLRRQYIEAFRSAQHRISVAHGYFLPDPGVVASLTEAASRGVQVRLLLAGRSDVPFARAATRSLHRRLLGGGVTIHEWTESVLHAKVATVDGCRLLIGSFNLDPFSLANLEALVEVTEPQLVAQGEAWIHERIAISRTMTALEADGSMRKWVLDPLGRVIARLAEVAGRVVGGRRLRGARTWRRGPAAALAAADRCAAPVAASKADEDVPKADPTPS